MGQRDAAIPDPCHAAELDDLHWLVGDEAQPWFTRAAEHPGSLSSLAKTLRRDLSPVRAALLLEQIALRKRAAVKFQFADRMFFTRLQLEQATDQWIAAYKAARFAAHPQRVDLCCGIGGDLQALAAAARCHGVDRDPVVAVLAEANCRAVGCDTPVVVAEACAERLPPEAAWHIDPDRRSRGPRTTQVTTIEPPWEQILQLRNRSTTGAVKLAPATSLDAADAQREWIGSRGECRQQVVWWGPLARHQQHTATIVEPDGPAVSFHGMPDQPMEVADSPKRFLYEPQAALLAAKLQGALAQKYGLARLPQTSAYLTSDDAQPAPLTAVFEVLEVTRLDRKRLRQLLEQRCWAVQEIKQRGAGIDPAQMRKQLRPGQGEPVTLIIAGGRTGNWVAVTQRCSPPAC